MLIAFSISAVFALFAIVWGYLSDSLPDSSLSQLDYYVITRLGRLQWPGLASVFLNLIRRLSLRHLLFAPEASDGETRIPP